jgi:hypothetical protein
MIERIQAAFDARRRTRSRSPFRDIRTTRNLIRAVFEHSPHVSALAFSTPTTTNHRRQFDKVRTTCARCLKRPPANQTLTQKTTSSASPYVVTHSSSLTPLLRKRARNTLQRDSQLDAFVKSKAGHLTPANRSTYSLGSVLATSLPRAA